MGLSLWLVPNELEAQKLESVMNIRQKGSSLSGGTYPKFYPHVTLASLPLSLENDLDKIEASISKPDAPMQCYFADVKIGDHYFRSVYMAIKPTSDILKLYEEVHNRLGFEPRSPAFPHMSLCYIDDADAANGERQKFYDDLHTKEVIHKQEVGEDNVRLNCVSGEQADLVDHFRAYEVWAVRCEGAVEGWDILRKIPLI